MHSQGKRKRDEEVLKDRRNIKIISIRTVLNKLGGQPC
jgi:hypothetical protein